MSEKLEVIFLGTGGGVPTTRRNVPAVALRLGGRWLLFDAGEGVQMRLRESPLGWGGLQAIFISHMHGDHVLGLPGLLMSLGMARIEAPVQIFGPPGLEVFVRTALTSCQVQLPFPLEIQAIPPRGGRLFQAEDFEVTAAPLRHRTTCFGFFFREGSRPGRFYPERAAALGLPAGPLYRQLQHGQTVTAPDGRQIRPEDVLGPPRPGRSVAYCTDTAPCAATVEHARDADLLIHDSTFTSEYLEEARISGHSTAAQAATQARDAHCRQLALTHISARFDDDRPLLAEAVPIFPDTLVARDLLELEIMARDE